MSKSIELRILKKLPNKSLVAKCGFCEGTGSFPSTATHDAIEDNLGPCSVCDGKGVVVFKETIDNLIECNYCGGTGQGYQDGIFNGGICEVCGGKGITTIFDKNVDREDESLWILLHPRVSSVAKSRMETQHYADAVEAAFKEYNDAVKKIVWVATSKEFDGADLMRRAFSVNDPVIKLTELKTDNDKSIQQGFMEISAGAMTGIRNPKAHANISISKKRAIHLLFLCSLLFQNIEYASNSTNIGS